MKKNIANSIIEHYSNLFKKYGMNHKALGWLRGKQSIRFNILSQIGIMDNSSVLDVGCGFGDFYGYLKYNKIRVKYHGVDINNDFLKLARKRYPGAIFELRDIQKDHFKRKFDWVVATGITNHASTYPHLKSIIKEMFSICKKGVVIDFISNYVDYKDKDVFYTSPEIMFKFAKSLTRRVVLRHDYMPFEFCLYLYKNDAKNSRHVFIEYYRSLSKTIQNDLWLKNTK